MIRRAALAGAWLALAGCVHTGAVDDGLNYRQRQERLRAITDWDLEGRLNIDTGEDNRTASVSWAQRDDRLILRVSGPLGAGAFEVDGDAASLTVRSRDGTEILTDPERQLSQKFGWWLPVTSLPYWLLGRPDPEHPESSERGAGGTLARLAQRRWRIVYDEYRLAGDLLVPERMTLTLADSTLELRLRVRDFGPAAAEP